MRSFSLRTKIWAFLGQVGGYVAIGLHDLRDLAGGGGERAGGSP
jgi:hypothetical protein